jgi:hypothetical protein
MGTRIKGQEVELLFIQDGKPISNITSVRDLEITPKLEILSEGYLGQTTEQKDFIFNGISGKLSIHFGTQDILKFTAALVDQARRRVPGAKINLKTTLNFPNGQRPRILIPDCAFGEMPMSFGGRKEYGTVSINFEASGFNYMY